MTDLSYDTLLVANRGEIAARIVRSARELGLRTVAVFSEADRASAHVRAADTAVRLGPPPGAGSPGAAAASAATATYLDVEQVLAAARATGAGAVHPGYGFLSEDAGFASAVEDAGLAFAGPAADVLRVFGTKHTARAAAAAAGVPMMAGSGLLPHAAAAVAAAEQIGFPLILKATGGGGGIGMRVCRTVDEVVAAYDGVTRQAAQSFSSAGVFAERYVERARHVEVQVFGDGAGRVLALGDRDCSLQRRHQKVVEEAPAPGVSDAVRTALHDAARAAAEAIDYRGAGTVEFLYDPDTERFFFLEMNTRLQVEHPVTEAVHGVDLVALQLAAAEAGAGASGSCAPARAGARAQAHDPSGRGHAIEVRLYAEDPAADYAPQSGTLTLLEIPDGVRVDSGFETGSEVSTHYDAMLAKVVAHAPTREQAARKLAGVLSRARIHGVKTNRDQLVATLRDPRFLAGEVTTALLPDIEVPPVDAGAASEAAAYALAEQAKAERTVQRGIPIAWRNVPSQPQVTSFESGDVTWWPGGALAASPTSVTLEADGVRTTYAVAVSGDVVDVDWPGGHVALRRTPRFVDPADAVATGSLLAPMPGTVVSVAVATGDPVEAGQPVLVLEAMKMQHTVRAPGPGTVTQLDVQPGAQVAAGEVLAVVEETP